MEYRLWKAPTNGVPEQSGHGVTILPGFNGYVLLHPSSKPWPKGSIPIEDVVKILDKL